MPGYAHDTWPQHENDSHTIQGIPTYYAPLKSSIRLHAILSSDSFINKLFSYPRLILFGDTPSYTLPASGLLQRPLGRETSSKSIKEKAHLSPIYPTLLTYVYQPRYTSPYQWIYP